MDGRPLSGPIQNDLPGDPHQSRPGYHRPEVAGQLARRHNLILNVDKLFRNAHRANTIDYGADLVVHSATKWIDGQGRVLGGIVVEKKN